MVQIPLLSGIYTDSNADIRSTYPRNLLPTVKDSGLSKGHLRPSEGLVQAATGIGRDRGGINWFGVQYRVMGTNIVQVSAEGVVLSIGTVIDDGYPAAFAYDYDTVSPHLAIVVGSILYYWVSNILVPALVPDVSDPFDIIWIDGYFVLTDGNSIYCTTLGDVGNFNPYAYGSAESDPGPIMGLLKVRNELVAIKRYVMEFNEDIGGNYFPFQRIDGAEIFRGSVGRKTHCVFLEQIAFIGSGKNEPPAIWMGINGVSNKISSEEIDYQLQRWTEAELSTCLIEPRVEKNHAWLYVHLPDRTCVYDHYATLQTQEPVWFYLDSGLGSFAQYRCQNLVWCYDAWWFADTATGNLGNFSLTDSQQWGSDVTWEFTTKMIYNKGRQMIAHELELMCISRYVRPGVTPTISYSYSWDGVTWSQFRFKNVGSFGDRLKRVNWINCGPTHNWNLLRFRSDTQAHVSIMAIEARIEALGDNGQQ
jgi:hypothetical protein